MWQRVWQETDYRWNVYIVAGGSHTEMMQLDYVHYKIQVLTYFKMPLTSFYVVTGNFTNHKKYEATFELMCIKRI